MHERGVGWLLPWAWLRAASHRSFRWLVPRSTSALGSVFILSPMKMPARAPRYFRLLCWFIPGVEAGLILFFHNPSESQFYPVCLFHKLTGWHCPGCGSLRALFHLAHGHWATAFHFNPL